MVSKNEIEVNKKTRELLFKNNQVLCLKKQFEKATLSAHYTRNENTDQAMKISLLNTEMQKLNKELLQQKLREEDYLKKIFELERRIDMLLEKNSNVQQDSSKNNLINLVREIADLKINVRMQKNEIQRLNHLCVTLNGKNIIQKQKLENLKKQNIEIQNKEGLPITLNNQKQLVLNHDSLPKTLEFRMINESKENQSSLIDLLEHGPQIFCSQVFQEDTRQSKELVTLIANQFCQLNEFSSIMNSLLQEILNFITVTSIKDLQIQIAQQIRGILNFEHIYLWNIDQMTGILQTYDQSAKQVRGILHSGEFGNSMLEGVIVNKINEVGVYLYSSENDKVYGDRVLLIPMIGNDGKAQGLLDIRGITDDNSNCINVQYFGVIINLVSKSVQQKIYQNNAIQRELRQFLISSIILQIPGSILY